VDGLEQTYGDRLAFERVDYTSARGQALARRFLVRAHPTVLVIDRAGQVVANIPGVPRREQVAAAIEVAAAR
jgi:thioredoxin-related protein